MSAFTALTAWLAFSPVGMSVQDCGCFGDAFTLGHGATLLNNVLLWALAVWHLWVVRAETWHGLKGWRTTACCAVFSLAVPLYSAVWLPRWILPFGRGAALSAVPGFGVYDGRYEEVTDSLMEVSGSKPLVAVVSRRTLTADDLRKLSGFRAEAGAGRISLCLWMLPGLNGGAGMDVFYTDEVTLKSLLRAEVGFVVVDGASFVPSETCRCSVRHGSAGASWWGDDGRGRRPAVALRRLRVGGSGGDGLGAPQGNGGRTMKAAWGVAYKVACGVCLVWLAVVLGVAVHYGWRALVADTFVIPSDSMSPTNVNDL